MLKIGLRIPGACGNLPLESFAEWCKNDGFDAIDLGSPDAERVRTILNAGLEVGTIDLGGTQKLLSADAGERRSGIDECNVNLNTIAAAGADKAFCVFFPRDASQSRKESFENWKQSFPEVVKEAERLGVKIAVEGWPGPNNSALGVTPETLRAMFAAVTSDHFGINYDPSHLIRIGVDYKRALSEFSGRVIHVHGKDTAMDSESLYEYGNIGPSFANPVGFGGGDWRYTIPGEGAADWAFICSLLRQRGFDGIISLELEDFRYNGTEEGEKMGLSRARKHLEAYL